MWRRYYYGASGIILLLAIIFIFLLKIITKDLPSLDTLERYSPPLITKVLDKDGNLIAELFTEKRRWLNLNEIPVDFQNAVIAIEDDKFFSHWGISIKGIIRASIKNFLKGRVVEGGSTITQQLSKLLFLTQEKTLKRKIKEVVLALQLEQKFSKEEILELYCNQIYFGHGTYGLEQAARTFFQKSPSDLTLSEIALLAGLIRSPVRYSPFYDSKKSLNRRDVVLERMWKLGFITTEEKDNAKKEEICFTSPQPITKTAPYFLEFLKQNLSNQFDETQLYRAGLTIQTTLDKELQEIANRVIEKTLNDVDAQIHQNLILKNTYYAENPQQLPKLQAALVAIDSKTGGILAMVGGRDFTESQFNRATQAKRQPGSAIKPFVWLTALLEGYNQSTLIDDLPIAYYYTGRDWKLIPSLTDYHKIKEAEKFYPEKQFWAPENYDDKFFGAVTLRTGIVHSRNLVSVRLVDYLGPYKIIEIANKSGIRSHLEPFLSLGLGTSVLTLLEITSSFQIFANEGLYSQPYPVEKVVDNSDSILYKHNQIIKQVISPQYAYIVTDMLKGVIQEGTGKYARILKRPAAGKTGTSQDIRDLWFIGYTPDLICGVWIGYDDYHPIGKPFTSSSVAVPFWTNFMLEAIKKYPYKEFPVADGVIFLKVCKKSGMLSLPTCTQITVTFISGNTPTDFCNWIHKVEVEEAGDE